MKIFFGLIFLLLMVPLDPARSQTATFNTIPAEVHFEQELHLWDGFGINYVEAAQTRNYKAMPQDYGGFSLLDEKQKKEILNLVFSEEGLNVDIVKMFLDPWHQERPGGVFDHECTTKNMLYFVEEGQKIAKQQNKDLTIITTLYGPPPWATLQKHIGGRDLDGSQTTHLANYIVDWALFLRKRQLPVRYLSIHNEGEDFYRWNYEDGKQRFEKFDYNMYWPPKQVNNFIKVLSREIENRNINNLGVTNGEPSNWTRFYWWGYANSLYEDDEALEKLDLLTTHGFINGDFDKLSYGTANSQTTDLLREKKPGLHAWVTSFSWGKMDTRFVRTVHENIYMAKVNAIIPWAGIQNPAQWIEGDPNPGNAITVHSDGSYTVTQGYYFYKQLTSAGHRGMTVANTMLANPMAFIIAFSGNGTEHPDAFVLTSYIRIWGAPVEISISGTECTRFKAYRTNEDGSELFEEIGTYEVVDGKIIYDAPRGTTTTFIGID